MGRRDEQPKQEPEEENEDRKGQRNPWEEQMMARTLEPKKERGSVVSDHVSRHSESHIPGLGSANLFFFVFFGFYGQSKQA